MHDLFTFDLDSYAPTDKAKRLLKNAPILILVGPTGSGKDTLARELLKTNLFHKIVTHTTRLPRHNHGILEIDGQDYHFITPDQALVMLKDKEFIEAAITHGNLYGTSLAEFDKADQDSKIAVMDVDVHGVRAYRRLSDKTIPVFLLPPDFATLRERLINRYGHSRNDKDIKIRLNTALRELYELLENDYYYTVINDNLSHTLKTVEQIVATNRYDKQADLKARKQAKQLIVDIEQRLK